MMIGPRRRTPQFNTLTASSSDVHSCSLIIQWFLRLFKENKYDKRENRTIFKNNLALFSLFTEFITNNNDFIIVSQKKCS